MYHYILSIIFSTSFIGVSFAGNIFEIPASLKKQVTVLQQQNDTPAIERTDFSGLWKGKCTEDMGPDKMIIKQGKDALEIDGISLEFDTLNTFTYSNGSQVSVRNIFLKADKKDKMFMSVNYDNLSTYSNSATLEHGWSHIRFNLKNKKLILKITANQYRENQPFPADSDFLLRCVYEKADMDIEN